MADSQPPIGADALADPTETTLAAVAERVVAGAVLVGHRPLTGGVSASVHLVEVRGPDAQLRRLVLRRHLAHEWKPHHDSVTRTEYALLGVLARAGLRVPTPLAIDDSGELMPTPYFVMEFVRGQTQVGPASLPLALRDMAAFLVQLHDLDPHDEALAPLPTLEDPLRGAVQYLPPDSRYDALRSELEASTIPSTQPSVLHGDYWPGNILFRDGRIAAVIDWEDASLGDPMSDVACARIELRCAHGEAAMQTFTDHYAATRAVEVNRLAVWEIYAAASALATMSQWGLAPAVEQSRRHHTQVALQQAIAAWRSGPPAKP